MTAQRPLNRQRKFFRILAITSAVLFTFPLAARLITYIYARGRIHTNVSKTPERRVALVLGCKVHPNGKLSTLLSDRVKAAVKLYKAGKVEKLLMSGDNRFSHYNEPMRMRNYAIRLGVPAEDIGMDFAGRRTYDSIYRARHIFGQNKITIISQGFHLDRSIFIAKRVGVDAIGFSADVKGHGNNKAKIRELPASAGAMVDAYIRRPKPVMGKREEI